MRVAMKSHALPVYKKNRIASLLCIFETIILNFKQLRCKVIQKCLKTLLCIFNTFTSKYFHFAHVILTMLSSTYHFWGVHNLHQAKSAKLNIGDKSKVGLFFFFLFSLFVFHLSFFVIRFLLFVIRFRYSFFTFGLSPVVSAFRFFSFRFSFF